MPSLSLLLFTTKFNTHLGPIPPVDSFPGDKAVTAWSYSFPFYPPRCNVWSRTFSWPWGKKTDPLIFLLPILATTLLLPMISNVSSQELVWMLLWRVKCLATARKQAPDCQAHSPVAVLSRRSQLPTFHLKWRAIATTGCVNKSEFCVKLFH